METPTCDQIWRNVGNILRIAGRIMAETGCEEERAIELATDVYFVRGESQSG